MKFKYNLIKFVIWIINIIIAIDSLSLSSNAETPPVQIWLKTSWNAPQLVLEILESVSAENSTAYFPLVEEFLKQGLFSSKLTNYEIYKSALDIIEKKKFLYTPTTKSLFEFGLSLHTTAPTIQSYYHYYNSTIIPTRNSSNEEFNPDCDVWVDWYGNQACNVESLTRFIDTKLDISNPTPNLLSFDHIRKSKVNESEYMIILYADLSSPKFPEFFNFLNSGINNINVNYVLRYIPPKENQESLYLSGYGVELALKNTDYIVIDDRKVEAETDDVDKEKESINDSESSNDHLFDQNISEIKPLKAGEIKSLGVKTAQVILESQDPLKTLTQLSQDFPKYSHYISQVPLSHPLVKEIEMNQEHSHLESNLFWLNGLVMNPLSVDPFSLLKLLSRERQTISSFLNLGLNPGQAIGVLSSPIISESQSLQDSSRGVFDVRDISPNNNVVVWLNDIEKDSRYSSWPNRIQDLLRPVYPGQLRMIRKNIFSILFILDFLSPDNLDIITDQVKTFISRNIPLRFGLIPLFSKDQPDAIAISRIFYYIVDQFDSSIVMKFFEMIFEIRKSSKIEFLKTFEQEFNKLIKKEVSNNEKLVNSFEEIINGDNTLVEEQIHESSNFIKRFKINTNDRGVLFVNGKFFDLDEFYQRNMVQTVNELTVFLQQKVYLGEINDETDIYEYLLTLPNIPNRRNPYIFTSELQPLQVINLADDDDNGFSLIDNLKYIYSENDDKVPVTIILISDFDNVNGISQIIEALKYLKSTKNVRISIIHQSNQSSTKLDSENHFNPSTMIYHLLYEEEPITSNSSHFQNIFEEYLEHLEGNSRIGGDDDKQIPIGQSFYNLAHSSGWQIIENIKAEKFWQDLSDLKIFEKFEKDKTTIIVNGRIIGPFAQEDIFYEDDFQLLIDIELSERISPVIRVVDEYKLTKLEGNDYSNFMAKISSIISASSVSDVPMGIFDEQEHKRDISFMKLKGDKSRIKIGNAGDAIYNIMAVIDPISEIAQKWSTILMILSQMEGVYIEIYLYPRLHMEEIPLKRFYRYVLNPRLNFDSNNGTIIPSSAHFVNLPDDVLLTLGMDVISSWLVTPKSSIYDLDNIKLSNLDIKSRVKGIEAIFELKNILIEGHARDLTSNNRPPRGLQLQLGTNSYPSMVDTIVMANLGYFQLKANPGVWTLSLREGKSTDIFDIQSVGNEGWLSRNISEIGNEIVLNGFEGLTIYPRMIRKSGKENDDVLKTENDNDNDGIWDYLKHKFTPKKDEKKKAEINIFSVASGHLYERFLSIMILSVLQHTNSTVKFWFIENFLSPTFKDFIPHMAKEYNFEYELVTYKWPHWLRAQTEKQRTIWGYKILFLDVLFPLDLDKVIFVDADQIVRTDLKELVDMDLQGAPYGYTPFCDNRPEMDGFRFWNHGYWKDHLRGKPYHISALYVIDLQQFRLMAAGDNLRGQYQALSVDPNSLSNLDQDLPNNMQHLIPIFSLPQDWLWCETWCSDESLTTAKTIDLCNNPLTKEPKLDRAKRQIPEWESYDKKVADLAARISQQKDSILTSNEIQDQKIKETNDDGTNVDETDEVIIGDVTIDDETNYETDVVYDGTNDESKEKIIVEESTNVISSASPTTHRKDEL
ncbi:hypothetical protein Glove_543g33 [Diversispora epigaea]|uniref:Uncharacterized protein n=1 Tax=Diversispora epigaea TaxID=1348612 RepID=A0A397GDY5_9GLOM|nr:hypothetical protein Glove_543g33 [Diversispora epigaea]